MISTQLSKLAQQQNWQTLEAEDSIYGLYNGYRFTVMEGKGFKAVFVSVAGITGDNLSALQNWLAENTRQLKLRNFELADNFLCVRLQESWRARTAEQIEWFLAQLSGMLSQFELPTDSCAICGEQADKQGLLHGLFCALHPECQDRETVDFTHTSESVESSAEASAGELIQEVTQGEVDDQDTTIESEPATKTAGTEEQSNG
ncbi:MAG: hypothetical protein PHQ83_02295 [Eubacteriales bacterium]|nr:hypothetical protein [Eubacteriales bacterium]